MHSLESLTRLLALARFDRPQEAAVLAGYVRKALEDGARASGDIEVRLQQAVAGQDKALLAVGKLNSEVEALEGRVAAQAAEIEAKDAEIAELKKPKRRGRKPKAKPEEDSE